MPTRSSFLAWVIFHSLFFHCNFDIVLSSLQETAQQELNEQKQCYEQRLNQLQNSLVRRSVRSHQAKIINISKYNMCVSCSFRTRLALRKRRSRNHIKVRRTKLINYKRIKWYVLVRVPVSTVSWLLHKYIMSIMR
jgi:hypothetical protein